MLVVVARDCKLCVARRFEGGDPICRIRGRGALHTHVGGTANRERSRLGEPALLETLCVEAALRGVLAAVVSAVAVRGCLGGQNGTKTEEEKRRARKHDNRWGYPFGLESPGFF